MSEVVFILGAGASVESGAPLMSTFLDRAHEFLLSDSIAPDTKDDFINVFRWRSKMQSVHSKAFLDLNNIEEILGALETARLLDIQFAGQRNATRLQHSMRVLIRETIRLSQVFPLEGGTLNAPPPYNHFARKVRLISTGVPTHADDPVLRTGARKKSISIITFNYDCAVEIALNLQGIKWNYGIGPTESDSIPVLKLHGSLNWSYCKKCKKLLPHRILYDIHQHPGPRQQRFLHYPDTIEKQSVCKPCGAIGNLAQPVIIAPGLDKFSSYALVKNVWARAAQELRDALYVCVVGYSHPPLDSAFHFLYALGTFGEEPLRKFVLVDNDPHGIIENRYLTLLGLDARQKFSFVPELFSKAIGSLPRWFDMC